MVASNIGVFMRVRPSAKPSAAFVSGSNGALCFDFDKLEARHEHDNNSKAMHSFCFNGVLGMEASQEEVFQAIAKPVIEDVLTGVNGTVFAYGQTGSGKTFTITGGAERYADRGLIPRTIKHMFDAFQKGHGQYRMHISYLEIYNDNGYDLLRDDSVQKLEELPKVLLREDEMGNIRLSNLSVNVATSEEEALNLLFMGDTNRVVAETPMNDASTRSHCLFIIWVDSTEPGSDVVRRSKLHLVDLAGSERVSKTGLDGNLLKEAKYINLSLHFLEQVIVALHDRSKGRGGHVPYRNSMMTSVLRDSLGGNCKTTMVGCIAVEPGNINESISTCRFAQRVGQIQNNATVNEDLDPNLLIARLKREVAELREEVRVSRKGDDAPLTPEGVEQCRALVFQYLSSGNQHEPFVCGSVERLRTSFRILRDMCNAKSSGGVAASGSSADRQEALKAQAQTLRLEVAQRGQEIGILVQMLAKQRGSGAERNFISAQAPPLMISPVPLESIQNRTSEDAEPAMDAEAGAAVVDGRSDGLHDEAPGAGTVVLPWETKPSKTRPRGAVGGSKVALPSGVDAAELLLDRQRAFEVFRRLHPLEAFEENKDLLKGRITEAKVVGDEANRVRTTISAAKTRLERLRTERAVTAVGPDDEALEDGPEESACVAEIERLKGLYRKSTDRLRQVKMDVEHIQKMMEANRAKTLRDFTTWFSSLRKQTQLEDMDEERKLQLIEKAIQPTVPAPTRSGGVLPTVRGEESPRIRVTAD